MGRRIALLKVGDKARFVIPSDLGYGPGEQRSYSTKRNIDFDVELMDVK
jgi:peptidyl-prolyl cis-trans isomerase A (cyclophilin A)